jgi:hypothetical protein
MIENNQEIIMHLRKCDSKECENPATHWLVWTGPQFYCQDCAEKMLGVADAMGFPTPASTVRPLNTTEMLLTDETDTEENQS